MSLPFVTRGKPCPKPPASRRKKPWRPPPCKFERRKKTPGGGTYCSVCAPQKPEEEEDSLQNLKDLNSSIHRLDEEIRRQKGKVMRGLIGMEGSPPPSHPPHSWGQSLDKVLVCTCNLPQRGDDDESTTLASEFIHRDTIKQEVGASPSTSSGSDCSRKKTFSKRKKSKRHSKDGNSLDGDKLWLKSQVAELVSQNESLQLSLRERDVKLEEAGKKIEEILEQNALLSHRLKEIYFARLNDDNNNVSGQGKEVRSVGGDSYQKELSLLRQKLSDSQVANRNLETYIEYLKKSYVSVFGSVGTST